MSCFVVDTECMDRIVYFVLKNTQQFCGFTTADFSYADETTPDQIGRLLYKLNEDAWNYRYSHIVARGEEEPAKAMQEGYTWRLPRGSEPSDVQTLKSIRCFLYQCTEGDQFMETDAFKHLEMLSDALAYKIVTNLPEYNEAKWG
jgi:hypothetical protein